MTLTNVLLAMNFQVFIWCFSIVHHNKQWNTLLIKQIHSKFHFKLFIYQTNWIERKFLAFILSNGFVYNLRYWKIGILPNWKMWWNKEDDKGFSLPCASDLDHLAPVWAVATTKAWFCRSTVKLDLINKRMEDWILIHPFSRYSAISEKATHTKSRFPQNATAAPLWFNSFFVDFCEIYRYMHFQVLFRNRNFSEIAIALGTKMLLYFLFWSHISFNCFGSVFNGVEFIFGNFK